MPHFADKENPIFRQIENDIPNSVILDVTKEPVEFLKDLVKCKAIISTALHPLIVCDSLNIPNMWCRISEQTTSRYKFHDYYSAFDLHKEPYNLLEKNFDEDCIKKLVENYDIPRDKVEEIKKRLKAALFNLKKDVTYKYYKQIFLDIISVKILRKVLKKLLWTDKIVLIKKIKCKVRKKLASHPRNIPLEITNNTKCLMVTPHADDETIGGGGVMLHYPSNFDCVCISSLGLAWKNITSQERTKIRIKEFHNVMDEYGIKNRWIFEISESLLLEPELEQIKKNYNNYLKVLDIKKYDYIFMPHPLDDHPVHQYITNKLMPKIIRKKGHKKNLKIVYYEVWSPIQKPNWFEDISDVVDRKFNILRMYESQRVWIKYDERIEGLNKYRGLLKGNIPYAEAYFIK